MAVSVRAQGSVGVSNTTSLTLSMPAGVQVGDYLVAAIHFQGVVASDVTLSGWSRAGAPFLVSNSGTRVTGFFVRVVDGTEPSAYAFTMPGTARSVGFITAFSGVDIDNPIASATSWSLTGSAGTSLSVPADTAAANVYTLEIWAAGFVSQNSYALSSYTGGLSLLGEGFNPSGVEDTNVARSAMKVWSGVAPAGGVPAHFINTNNQFAHACASLISLNAAPATAETKPIITGRYLNLNNGNGTSFTLNPAYNPVGSPLVTGNWMILTISSSSQDGNVPTIPAEWQVIRPYGIVGTVGSGTSTFGVWAKIRQAGETTYTFSQAASSNNTTSRIVWGARGDDPSHWVLGTFSARINTGTTTTNVASSITTTKADSLAIVLSHERTTATETEDQISQTNFTRYYADVSTGATLVVAQKAMPTAGATGDVVVTYPNTHSQNGMAGIVAVPPKPPAPSGIQVKVSTGSALVNARLKVVGGAGTLITPGALKVVRPGYTSVSQMTAQSLFYCAHRGGSRDFPEMSLYAYGQSALIGYPALELSLARTSDGVWFGLHDASLDRTSQNTGGGSGTNLVASSMTWAQVQQYEILGQMASNNTSQPNRPYMHWEELMSMYYASHVIFVDPKAAVSFRTELLNMMDALPNSTTKFVAKYYGVSGGASNTSGWNFDAKARGYKTWGYFYDSDSANYATYAPRWDILGMNYNAAQSFWDDLRAAAPGKPVMGHICPDAAAVSAAVSKGANGVMVSGVKLNVPPAIT